ncbi:MAG: alpha-(1-_3)-arabinofuranosyltransferase family protein [Acidimicrobiia bacterium]
MNGTTGVRARGRRLEILGLGLLAYVPFLLSSPGRISADTKHFLYLEPGRMLSRAPYLWDPHFGTGTVPHQNVGFLFPMGPYYWAMEQVGVPDWVAQRLWWGTLSFAAGLGVLWLLTMLGTRRVGAIAAALVYMLSPYQLAFTARLSVLLLPWAALPWLVGLTVRALKRGGWRDPALFALVVLAAGSTSAPSLMLVGIAPVLWLVFAVLDARTTPRVALAAAGRIGVLTMGVSVWWATGLVTQSRYGIPILDVTENLEMVASASNPADLLRGLGNWFLSGSDRLGRWLDQSAAFADDPWLSVATYAIPGLALVGAAALRWRYRAYFAALVVVGVIVGVGTWPYDHPSPVGALFKDAAESSAFGLALRNTPRVVPIIVLGVAGLLAAAISALSTRCRLEMLAAGVVTLCVIVGFAPVWQHGSLSEHLDRAEDIPGYWADATDALGGADARTRVLELPGSLFAAYRWGDTVDPITPGLTDRAWVARELPPHGSPAGVDLLAALDRRMQEGTFEPQSLARIARFFRSGTLLVRSDLEYERFETPRPRVLWALLTDPLAPGLGEPKGFGPGDPNRASPSLEMFDELELVSSGSDHPPEVALIPVDDVPGLVGTASTRHPVIVAGSGDGLVDAAAAGLLEGDELVLYAASLGDAELRDALRQGADLVVTDSNRRRARRWDTLRDETGMTERAGQTSLRDDISDYRLEPVSGNSDAERTVAEQRGGRVDATGYGFTGVYLPEDRPVHAFDGDTRTAWRAAGGEDVAGQSIVLRPHDPVRTDQVRLVQPLDLPNGRWLTRVRLHFDRGAPVTVNLDESSRAPNGQIVTFPERTIRKFEVELLEPTAGADPVGFAEIYLGDVRVEEIIRPPVTLLDRAGRESTDHRVVFVLSRQRYESTRAGREDAELTLVRRIQLPEQRGFSIAGTARVNPDARDDLVDALLGTAAPGVEIRSSGHLHGDVDSRASLAFDNDPETRWTAALGEQEGQYVEIAVPEAVTIDQLGFDVLHDGRHSVPTRLQLVVDGVTSSPLNVPAVGDSPDEGASHSGVVRFPAVTGTDFQIVVEAVRPVTHVGDNPGSTVTAPVSMNVLLPGVTPTVGSGDLDRTCRADLVEIDGEAVPVQLEGDAADARTGFTIEPCGPALDLDRGSHVIRSQAGLDTGIDIDRLLLASSPGGGPAPDPTARVGARPSSSGTRVHVVDSGMTNVDVRVRTDGKPFWLVLGQSLNDGWEAELADGTSLGKPRLVNGYANGWTVDPSEPGTLVIHLRWKPQRLVWIGMAVSVIAILGCLVLLWRTRRRAGAALGVEDTATLTSPFTFGASSLSPRTAVGAAVLTGAAAAVVSRPWIGLLVGAGTLLAMRVRGGRVLLVAGAPAALLLSKAASAPELGWVAVLLLGADVVCSYALTRGEAPAPAER